MNPALLFRALRGFADAGALPPLRVKVLLRMLRAWSTFGQTPATAGAAAAARFPHRIALIDELGSMTYAELNDRAAALATRVRGQAVGVLCRNGRGFVEALLAATRLGCDVVLLDTELSAPQLADVLDRRRISAVLHDSELEALLDAAGFDGQRLVPDMPGNGSRKPRRGGRLILLTSGTTGTPKGAVRRVSVAGSLGPVVAHLRTVPLRSGQPMLIAPPLFHGFGLVYLGAALLLGCPLVLRKRFDAEQTLIAIERHRVGALIAVPHMLQRLLAATDPGRVASPRVVVSGAAPLGPALTTAFMDRFGPVLYNAYGSVEAGWGAIAGPADLRAAPGTVGRPPDGVDIRILDDSDSPVRQGETGRICLGGGLLFDGYADDGPSSGPRQFDTGDLGHLDSSGRLFIDGRSDDMIVSGGENVFPQAIEDQLAVHDGVAEVMVVGVPDDRFGQRLSAYVVRTQGHSESADELLRHLKNRLARYQLPRDVHFVDSLPRTATGKVRRRSETPGPIRMDFPVTGTGREGEADRKGQQ